MNERNPRVSNRGQLAARPARPPRGPARPPPGLARGDHGCGRALQQGAEGEAGAGGEHAAAVGRGADGAVGAGAQPPPAGPLQGGGGEAEAAAADAEEPGLRRQLPGEARLPEGRAAEAEDGAGVGGGQAGPGECCHALGARHPARQVRGPAGLRPHRGRPRAPRQGGHRQRHHHRQVRHQPGRLLLVPASPPRPPRPCTDPSPWPPGCFPPRIDSRVASKPSPTSPLLGHGPKILPLLPGQLS